MPRGSNHAVRDHQWMLRLGGPLFLAALGIALEVNDVHSHAVQTGAWAAVIGGAFLLVTGSLAAWHRCVLRRHAARQRRGALRRHSGHLVGLGKSILKFKHDRDALAPTLSNADVSSLRHPVKAARARQAHAAALHEHEEDTLTLYERRFSAEVRSAVSELLYQGQLGRHEAHALIGPQSSAMIERIGLQLVELGRRHGRGETQAA